MATAMQQGIMGLPQGPDAQDPSAGETIDPSLFSPVVESYARNKPVEFGNDMLASMEAADPAMVQRFKSYLANVKLPAKVIDAMGQMVDLVLGNPEKYKEIRAGLLSKGVPKSLLPEEFDPAFFAALNIALDQLEGAKPQEPAVMQMAKGGIAKLKPLAAEMAKMGRGEDKMLAHITRGEARLLRRRGGRGSTNPSTGLPEFGFFDDVFGGIGDILGGIGDAISDVVSGIGDIVKDIASSDIGRIALTVAAVYFMGPAGLNLAGTAGSITGLTGSLAVGVNTFAASTLVGLASGQSFGDALKSGAVAGIMGGFGSAIFGLPAGYEGGTPTPPGGVEVIDRSFQSGGSPPGSTPGVGAGVGSETPSFIEATTTAVPNPDISVIKPLGPQEVVGQSLDPVKNVVTAKDVATNAAKYPAAAQVAAPPVDVVPPVQAPPVPVPEPWTGSGIKVPKYTLSADGSPNVNLGNTSSAVPKVALDNVAKVGIESIPKPGFMESLQKGNYMDAAKAAYNNISPSGIQEQGTAAAQDAGIKAMESLQARIPGATPSMLDNAYQTAYKAALPGMVATYGPLALAGLGTMAALGGTKAEKAERPPGFDGPSGFDLLKSNPQTYGLSYGGTRSSYALNPYDYMYSSPQSTPVIRAATGGVASLEQYRQGGQPSNFPRKNGPINGPGTGTSDSIPAMLSDGEFVFTAKAVRGAGGGSRRAGAKRMYALMKAFEGKA